MRRSACIWITFALSVAVVLLAMGWISLKALRLERDEIAARRQEAAARSQADQARRQAALEQDVQLALYRMEFAIAPLVARESARPCAAYSTLLSAGGGAVPGAGPPVGKLLLSPLVAESSPDVLLYFQFEPDGRLTSPRVPDPVIRELVVPRHLSRQAAEEAQQRLAELAAAVDRDKLLAMLPDESPQLAQAVVPLAEAQQQRVLNDQFQWDLQQRGRDFAEYNRRSQAVQQTANVNTMLSNQPMPAQPESGATPPRAEGVLMRPLWVEGRLLLARRVHAGKLQYVQGCLLDWPAIKEGLLMAVEDLLPEADLEPVAGDEAGEESHRLAALPVRLVPGRRAQEVPAVISSGPTEPAPQAALAEGEVLLTPIRLSLLLAWGCVLLAGAAVAALVAGVMRLSERRAAFVSAVTHELRTPLTTFHMYTEMLAEGMVPEPQRQHEYLSTLRSEAARLSHLVENVLAYARLERGRTAGRIEDLSLEQLLKPIRPRLSEHARREGMEIVVEGDEAAYSAVVRANPSAVEQILLNLVDNAGKYARAAADRRIYLSVGRAQGAVEVRVRDHGPGVSPAALRRLFRSFSKSAHEAANSAPGVGLGLSLSRRLARDMGARLTLDKSVTDGACFVLALAASQQAASRSTTCRSITCGGRVP